MVKGTWLCSMVVLLALASTTVALYCWDSVLLERGKVATCHPEQDTCFTVEFGRFAWKGCSKFKTCGLAMTGEIGIKAILKGFDVAFSGIPGFQISRFGRSFADKLFGKEDSSDEGLINVDCCSADYCNLLDNIYVPVFTRVPYDKSTDVPNRIHVTNRVHVPDSTAEPDLPEFTAEPDLPDFTAEPDLPDFTADPYLPDSTAVPDRSLMPNLSKEFLMEFVIECYNNDTCKKQSKATFSEVQSDKGFDIVQSNATSSEVQSNKDFDIVQSNATFSKVQSNKDFDIVQSNATSSKVQSNEDFNMVQNHTTSDIPPNHATCSKMTKLFVLVLSFALYLICC